MSLIEILILQQFNEQQFIERQFIETAVFETTIYRATVNLTVQVSMIESSLCCSSNLNQKTAAQSYCAD